MTTIGNRYRKGLVFHIGVYLNGIVIQDSSDGSLAFSERFHIMG